MWTGLACHGHARMNLTAFFHYLFCRLFFPHHPKTMELLMLRLLNKDRRRHGLKPVLMQSDLRRTARKHSKDMAEKDYFDHTNLWGQSHADRYKEDRISDLVSGENLAKIAGYSMPVHRAELGLMNSPGHRANILNPDYNCVGIGVYKSKDKAYYFTQNFAKRALIFTQRIPYLVRRKKGLTLQFKAFGPKVVGVYRILENNSVIKEKSFPIHPGINRLPLSFPARGLYEVAIYTGHSPHSSLALGHQFSVKVNEGWFG